MHRLAFLLALPLLWTPSAPFVACGHTCPFGWHVVETACNVAACPGWCPNQVVCARDVGAAFQLCGPVCPFGFHLVARSCNVAACPGPCPNVSVCERD
jgi:hypothetical protein